MSYTGRFAPSPTGPLHAGSLVAALASWLDARAHGGLWLVRIEDVDTPRCVPGADAEILRQLAVLGLRSDAPVQRQSQRTARYARALEQLATAGLAYPCACTRQQIAAANARQGRVVPRHGELVYPGTCRPEHGGLHGQAARAWRLQVDDNAFTEWCDRRLGPQVQRVGHEVGDFVLQRADGLWAYQLAVVVDDAEQGVTDVVRGEDLADNTARQCVLQQRLGLPPLRYLHVPLVLAADGEKLSKQRGATPLDLSDPHAALRSAARDLGLPDVLGILAHSSAPIGDALAQLVSAWTRWFPPGAGCRVDEQQPLSA